MGGALKVVDPSGTVGAARALGLPAGNGRVRALAATEVVVGALTLAVPGRILAGLVGASYAGFAILTARALVRRLPIDSCGCLGRLETPPSWRHVVVLVVLALGSAAAAVWPSPVLFDRIGGGVGGLGFALVAVGCTGMAVLAFTTGRRPVGGRA